MPITDTRTESCTSSDHDDDVDAVGIDDDVVDADPPKERTAKGRSRQVSFSLRTVVVSIVICLLVATAGVLGWLYVGARDQLADQAHETANRKRAEEIAADYAVHAAEMNYQDFGTWKVKLVNGTSPELKEKLIKAADSMQQVLMPLQWQSTAKPLATKVRAEAGGVYTVDSFVSVLTKTMQSPEGLQSTATYSITIDSNNNWQITDVGGIDSALGK